ncbi:hypothetical protein [Vibrio phage BONAISHI]|nr:hypothetical protein [Vibrio phage BONAISHI]
MSTRAPAPYSVQWYQQLLRMAATTAEKDNDGDGFPDTIGGGGSSIDLYDQSKSYDAGDLVIRNDDLFQANQDIPAGTNFVIGLSGYTWREISSSVLVAADFTAGRNYPENALVIRDNVLLRAKVEIAGGPFSINQWEKLQVENAVKLTLAGYDETKTYDSNQMILDNGMLKYANQDGITGTFDASKWETVTANFTLKLRDYVNNGEFTEGELVLYDKRMYKANSDLSNPGDFDPADWTIVGGSGGIPAYLSSNTYLEGDVVTQGDYIYRAKESGISGAWNVSKWEEIAGRSRMRGDFVTGTSVVYKASDVVFHEGQLWKANSTITGPEDFNVGTSGATWSSLSRKGSITPYFTDHFYVKGDHVIYDRRIWSAKDSKLHGAWKEEEWDFVADVDIILNGYSAARKYFSGNLIRVGKKIYSCRIDIEPKAFDLDDWEDVSGVMQGEHDSTRAYEKDVIVIKNNRFYRANGNIPKNTNFSEGTSGTQFTEISPPANPSAPDWADGVTYARFDLVINEGTLFRCTTEHTADGSFDASKFTSLKADAAAVVAEFETGVNYVKEQLIVSAGTLWRARKAITNSTADDGPEGANSATNWQAVSLTYINISDHSATTYRQNELTVKNGKLYRANRNIDSAIAFSLDDWDPISEETLVVKEFSDSDTYKKDQIVHRNELLYIAVSDLTAGAWDDSNWMSVNPRNPWRGNFSSSGVYQVDDMVVHEQSLWRSTAATDGEVFSTNNWERVSGNIGARTWTSGTTFHKGDFVTNDKKLYVANSRFTATSTFSDSNLTLVGDFQTTIEDYSNSETYKVKDLVIHAGAIWKCEQDIDTAETFDANKWKMIARVKAIVSAHDSTLAYDEGEQVIYDNKLYIATKDLAVNTAFDADSGDWLLVSSDAVVTEAWEATTAVTSGEVRFVNGVRMKSRSARTTGGTLDDTELSNWVLEAVTSSNKATLTWDVAKVITPGMLIDLDGKIYEANGTLVNGSALTTETDLPSNDIGVVKALGYRFKLNGFDVTSDVSAGTDSSRMKFATVHIDKGDKIEVLPPVV